MSYASLHKNVDSTEKDDRQTARMFTQIVIVQCYTKYGTNIVEGDEMLVINTSFETSVHLIFFFFTLYSLHNRVVVLRRSIPIKTFPFPTIRRVLEELRVK